MTISWKQYKTDTVTLED